MRRSVLAVCICATAVPASLLVRCRSREGPICRSLGIESVGVLVVVARGLGPILACCLDPGGPVWLLGTYPGGPSFVLFSRLGPVPGERR